VLFPSFLLGNSPFFVFFPLQRGETRGERFCDVLFPPIRAGVASASIFLLFLLSPTPQASLRFFFSLSLHSIPHWKLMEYPLCQRKLRPLSFLSTRMHSLLSFFKSTEGRPRQRLPFPFQPLSDMREALPRFSWCDRTLFFVYSSPTTISLPFLFADDETSFFFFRFRPDPRDKFSAYLLSASSGRSAFFFLRLERWEAPTTPFLGAVRDLFFSREREAFSVRGNTSFSDGIDETVLFFFSPLLPTVGIGRACTTAVPSFSSATIGLDVCTRIGSHFPAPLFF